MPEEALTRGMTLQAVPREIELDDGPALAIRFVPSEDA